jgi:predicted O-linked N-acetylglucosamine transferase (SPINDLY family)
MDTIDYRLTDPYLDPPGCDESFYCERSIRLPDTFWCYDPRSDEPQVNAVPCADKGSITFGCLNNFVKVNDSVLKLWIRVLHAVPDSRLILLAPQGNARRAVLDRLVRDGIGVQRIEFVGRQPRPAYLQSYHRIDIALDTFPYNGHTTSLDSLWMGVPVITLVGNTIVGRAGLSQLTNLHLTELIAGTAEQYIQIAMDLAGDRPRLAELRASLRQRMKDSPLMDAGRFARNIEAVYRTMWRTWCQA